MSRILTPPTAGASTVRVNGATPTALVHDAVVLVDASFGAGFVELPADLPAGFRLCVRNVAGYNSVEVKADTRRIDGGDQSGTVLVAPHAVMHLVADESGDLWTL